MDIRYLGNLQWVSNKEKDAIKRICSSIQYATNKKRTDLIYVENLNVDKWKQVAEQEIAKRKDARVAGTIVVALPNSFDVETAKAFIKDFVNEIGSSEYGFALHRPKARLNPEKDNLHAHIFVHPRGADGKKLRIDRKQLKSMQKKYDELVEKYTKKKPFVSPEPMKKIPAWRLEEEKEKIASRRRMWAALTGRMTVKKAINSFLQKIRLKKEQINTAQPQLKQNQKIPILKLKRRA